MLQRYGATKFGYLMEEQSAVIVFQCNERQIRFELPLPQLTDAEFTHTAQRKRREGRSQHAAWDQACRSKWRALLLCIKSKLEAVEAGIAQFEEEFLAYVIVPQTGETVYQSIREQVEQGYIGNERAPLRLTVHAPGA